MTEVGWPPREPAAFASRRERRAAEQAAAEQATAAAQHGAAQQAPAQHAPARHAVPPVPDAPAGIARPSIPPVDPVDPVPPVPPAPQRHGDTGAAARAQRHAIRDAAGRGRRSVGRAMFSSAAFLAVGALAVGMTLPSSALKHPSDDDAAAALRAVSTATAQAQEVTVAGSAAASASSAAERDTYTGTSYSELQQAAYQASGSGYAPGFVPTTGSVRWPFPYSVSMSSGYGEVRGDGIHNGTDFNPGVGAQIGAIADGVVTWVGWKANYGYGYFATIQHTVDGVTIESLYGHMIDGSSTLYPGQTVHAGDIVGLVGDTGYSFGPHLHLEIRVEGSRVDPYIWLTEHATNT